MRKKVIAVGVVVLAVALVVGTLAVAQPGERGGQRPGGKRPGGQRPGGPRGQFDPERMRQIMNDRLKEALGASDAEWKVIEPRLTKVMTLNRQASGGPGRGMMGMFFGGRRGPQGGPSDRRPGERPGPQGDRELTAVEKAGEALRTTLENEAATPDDIKAKLTALRTAREKTRQELAKAQKELRQILTLRQEAQLVLMGQLN